MFIPQTPEPPLCNESRLMKHSHTIKNHIMLLLLLPKALKEPLKLLDMSNSTSYHLTQGTQLSKINCLEQHLQKYVPLEIHLGTSRPLSLLKMRHAKVRFTALSVFHKR